MSKIKIFLMLSGYQLTWLMCVFGELLYNNFLPGLICGLLFLTICFINSNNKKKNHPNSTFNFYIGLFI